MAGMSKVLIDILSLKPLRYSVHLCIDNPDSSTLQIRPLRVFTSGADTRCLTENGVKQPEQKKAS